MQAWLSGFHFLVFIGFVREGGVILLPLVKYFGEKGCSDTSLKETE
jgi:hypothetical protein